jgi:DNA-binding XRE family transcriptional regulator
MVDYATNDLGIDSDIFLHMFIVSGAAKQFERGNPRYVSGRSGIEIADEIVKNSKTANSYRPLEVHSSKTPEYWAGWALSQYQWHTAKPFDAILRFLPFSDIIAMYPALHEADVSKFFDIADSIISKNKTRTNLKRIRAAAGITQKKLAKESGVSLRSIQMYEQQKKDINKAHAISLAAIARVLGCDMESLLEY